MADIVVTRCCINHFSCGTGTFTPQLCLCSSSCSSTNCSCKSEDMHGLLNHSSVGKACVGHEVCRHGISWLWVCVSQSRTRVRLSTTESFLPARYFRLLCSLILNYTVFLRHQKTQKTYKQHLNLFHSNWSIFFQSKPDHRSICFSQSEEDGLFCIQILILCCRTVGGGKMTLLSIN